MISFCFGQKDYKFKYEIKSLYCDSITKVLYYPSGNDSIYIDVDSYRMTAIYNYNLKIKSKDTTIVKPNMGKHDFGEQFYILKLKPGLYEFDLQGMSFFPLKQEIKISSGVFITFRVADVDFDDKYTVFSKKKLNQKKLDEIRGCILWHSNWNGYSAQTDPFRSLQTDPSF